MQFEDKPTTTPLSGLQSRLQHKFTLNAIKSCSRVALWTIEPSVHTSEMFLWFIFSYYRAMLNILFLRDGSLAVRIKKMKKNTLETQCAPLCFEVLIYSLAQWRRAQYAWACMRTNIHKHTNLSNTGTDMSAVTLNMSWRVSLEAAEGEPGDWMRPFESWLVTGRSIVKDSWASCFLPSLWGQWAPNMRGLGFYHTLPPSPPRICSSIDCDCLSFCLRPLLD